MNIPQRLNSKISGVSFGKNITIVEWPELILKNLLITNFFLMEFKIINSLERSIKLSHSQKKFFNVI